MQTKVLLLNRNCSRGLEFKKKRQYSVNTEHFAASYDGLCERKKRGGGRGKEKIKKLYDGVGQWGHE